MRKLVWLVFLIAIFSVAAEPEVVETGVYLLNLGKFDVATGSFTVDFYLSMKCAKNCTVENVEFMNGRATVIDKIMDRSEEKFYRIQANLNSPIDLKKFPFDRQRIQIVMEDRLKTVQELVYVPAPSETGLDPAVTFIGWNIDGNHSEVRQHHYQPYGENFSQYIYTLNISRIALNSFLKTILPVIFIIIVILSSFIIDPENATKITTRLTMSGSSLVAAVMFHVSISNQLPPVGYLTFADKFMILTYIILVLSFIMNILFMELQEKKKDELLVRIHRKTEYSVLIIFPVLYVLLFVVAL